MSVFLASIIMQFFIAFGIVLGGSLLAGIGAVFTLKPPAIWMENIADKIKIWAMVAAVGGTIDPLRLIESNISEGYLSPAVKQIVQFIFAFLGAQSGFSLIQWISKGGGQP